MEDILTTADEFDRAERLLKDAAWARDPKAAALAPVTKNYAGFGPITTDGTYFWVQLPSGERRRHENAAEAVTWLAERMSAAGLGAEVEDLLETHAGLFTPAPQAAAPAEPAAPEAPAERIGSILADAIEWAVDQIEELVDFESVSPEDVEAALIGYDGFFEAWAERRSHTENEGEQP